MITKDRNYRTFEVRALEDGMTVEGYAAVFDIPEVMHERDGIKYHEEVRTGAFSKTEMRDVVLNYNHGGKPVARTKNETLQLSVDERGLLVKADLSGTEEGRRLYEEVRGGYLDKMSFAFIVGEDQYDKTTRTRSIVDIKRVFDVAVVDFPAYESTTVIARSYFKAEAEKEAAEAVARELRKKKIKLLTEV